MGQIHNLRLLFLVIAMCSSLATSAVSAQSNEPLIEVELHCTSRAKLDDMAFTLRNSGESDTAVVLGSALGNGQVYLADALSIEVKLAGAPSNYTFSYFNRDHAFVAGRVDPWIIPLPAKSSFSISIEGDKFWSSALSMTLSDTADVLEIRANLAAQEIQNINADTTGLALMHVWVSVAQSSVVPFPSGCTQDG